MQVDQASVCTIIGPLRIMGQVLPAIIRITSGLAGDRAYAQRVGQLLVIADGLQYRCDFQVGVLRSLLLDILVKLQIPFLVRPQWPRIRGEGCGFHIVGYQRIEQLRGRMITMLAYPVVYSFCVNAVMITDVCNSYCLHNDSRYILCTWPDSFQPAGLVQVARVSSHGLLSG